MSTDQLVAQTVELPDGVTASMEGRAFSVKGRLGTVKKDFDRINVEIQVEGRSILIRPVSRKKKDTVISNTVHSLVENMVTGVTKGYSYRLKVVYAHFPISVKTKGDMIVVENFVGERSPRLSQIIGDCKVTVEGDDIVVKGVSLEDVGQTAANLELATKIKHKDQRIFLDGIYIYQKGKGW